MTYKLIVSNRADRDTIEAVDHYKGIGEELSFRFLEELADRYEQLKISPQYYSLVSTDPKIRLRDVKLHSFPYVVVFEINNVTVDVIAIMNTHQKPFTSGK